MFWADVIQKYDVLRGFTPPCPLSFPLFFHEVSVLYIVRGFPTHWGYCLNKQLPVILLNLWLLFWKQQLKTRSIGCWWGLTCFLTTRVDFALALLFCNIEDNEQQAAEALAIDLFSARIDGFHCCCGCCCCCLRAHTCMCAGGYQGAIWNLPRVLKCHPVHPQTHTWSYKEGQARVPTPETFHRPFKREGKVPPDLSVPSTIKAPCVCVCVKAFCFEVAQKREGDLCCYWQEVRACDRSLWRAQTLQVSLKWSLVQR